VLQQDLDARRAPTQREAVPRREAVKYLKLARARSIAAFISGSEASAK
jgi:hypothetical protein